MRLIFRLLFIVTVLAAPQFSIARHHCRHSLPQKATFEQEIPSAKISPTAYSGKLQRVKSFFWRPNYEYSIVDAKGKTIAFLDLTELLAGTSLITLEGKIITVNGRSFPHKYRGNIVVKVQSICTASA